MRFLRPLLFIVILFTGLALSPSLSAQENLLKDDPCNIRLAQAATAILGTVPSSLVVLGRLDELKALARQVAAGVRGSRHDLSSMDWSRFLLGPGPFRNSFEWQRNVMEYHASVGRLEALFRYAVERELNKHLLKHPGRGALVRSEDSEAVIYVGIASGAKQRRITQYIDRTEHLQDLPLILEANLEFPIQQSQLMQRVSAVGYLGDDFDFPRFPVSTLLSILSGRKSHYSAIKTELIYWLGAREEHVPWFNDVLNHLLQSGAQSLRVVIPGTFAKTIHRAADILKLSFPQTAICFHSHSRVDEVQWVLFSRGENGLRPPLEVTLQLDKY